MNQPSALSPEKGVSVVVCCYNSAERLPETLQHLARQRTPANLPWEIILVDNQSTDRTTEIARQIWTNYSATTPLITVNEPKQGLAHARTTGIQSAHYEYIIFCDDDNWLCDAYVAQSYRIMEADPGIGACGGRGIPFFGGEKPRFFDGCSRGFALGEQAATEGAVTGNTLYGAGLIIRKSVLTRLVTLGFQTCLSGRTGKSLSAGEDGELTVMLKILGYQLWYSPALTFQHYLPANRLNLHYMSQMFCKFGECNGVLQPHYALAEQKAGKPWLYHFARQLRNGTRRLVSDTSMEVKYIALLMDIHLLRTMIRHRNQFRTTLSELMLIRDQFVTPPLTLGH